MKEPKHISQLRREAKKKGMKLPIRSTISKKSPQGIEQRDYSDPKIRKKLV